MGKRIEQVKGFVKKHQKGILFVGGLVLGATAAILISRGSTEEVIKVVEVEKAVLPEWAVNWKNHCDLNDLLYENGLPIFANPECTIAYRDACEPDAIPKLIEQGLQIIDRV
jgi:hypothetical protein